MESQGDRIVPCGVWNTPSPCNTPQRFTRKAQSKRIHWIAPCAWHSPWGSFKVWNEYEFAQSIGLCSIGNQARYRASSLENDSELTPKGGRQPTTGCHPCSKQFTKVYFQHQNVMTFKYSSGKAFRHISLEYQSILFSLLFMFVLESRWIQQKTKTKTLHNCKILRSKQQNYNLGAKLLCNFRGGKCSIQNKAPEQPSSFSSDWC